jgi:NAD(P)-dependent dehydrogenase (short-subunit alcohol dehydrogenase family)
MKQNNHKIILVTGGSGLIGRALLKEFLSVQSWIVYNLDIAKSEISGVRDVLCDVTDPEVIKATLQSIAREHQRIDGLVNNAYPRTKDWGTPFEVEEYQSLQRNIEMQLSTVLYTCQQAGGLMTSGGSIVNISSIYGVVGNDPGMYEETKVNPPAAYSAIKGGLVNFTRFLAARWGEKNIRVNCVSPGGIFDKQDPEFVKRYEKRVPMKRMGTPEDIAPPVKFLLSDDSRYITGQNLIVDGGWTCI